MHPYASEKSASSTKYREAVFSPTLYQREKRSKIRAIREERAFSTGDVHPYASEKSTSSTKYREVYSSFLIFGFTCLR